MQKEEFKKPINFNKNAIEMKELDLLLHEVSEKIQQSQKGKVFLDKLTLENNADLPVNKHFLCIICSEVVIDPKQCSSCQKLYCMTCIDSWLLRSSDKECPHCRFTPFKGEDINRFVMETLEDIGFNCYQCEESFRYGDRVKHAHNCSALNINCPAKCGHNKFVDMTSLDYHLTNDCPKVVRSCTCCFIKNPSFILLTEQHKCQKKFDQVLKKLDEDDIMLADHCKKQDSLVKEQNLKLEQQKHAFMTLQKEALAQIELLNQAHGTENQVWTHEKSQLIQENENLHQKLEQNKEAFENEQMRADQAIRDKESLQLKLVKLSNDFDQLKVDDLEADKEVSIAQNNLLQAIQKKQQISNKLVNQVQQFNYLDLEQVD